METKRISIAKLKANTGQIVGVPTNPRQWSKEDVEKLAKSIEETPELFDARGIIVMPYDKDFIVLGGNMRLAAAKRLKHKDVPCIVLPADTPTEKLREIVIKDNGSFGAWDFDALANEWDDLPLSDWGVDVPEEWGVKADEYGDTFELKSGEKDEFGVMNFTVTEKQRELIALAIDASVYSTSYFAGDNKNKNGNGLYLIAREWVMSKMANILEEDEDKLREQVEELRIYLCGALDKSGLKSSDVDKLLGVNGMAGHYFGASQWMFPTKEAYESLSKVMELPRDYFECIKLIHAYEFVKKIKVAYGTL